MIKELPESEGFVLGFKITGKVNLAKEQEWINKFDKAIEKYGKVSALVILDEDASWGVKTGIEDLKWLIIHMKNLCRIALVSDSEVWQWIINIDSLFAAMMGIGEKHFASSEIDEAWTWLKD